MNNVLLIGPLNKVGGLSNYVRDLKNADLEFKIIHFNTSRPLKKRIRKVNSGYFSIFNSSLHRFLLGLLITFWHLIKFPFVLCRVRPRVVHIAATGGFVFWENSLYILTSKIFMKNTFFHYLGSFDLFYNNAGRLEKRLIRHVLLSCNEVAVLSNKVKMLIEKEINVKTHLIPSAFDFTKQNTVQTGNVKLNDGCQVLFIGGFDAFKKGILDVFSAIKQINNIDSSIHFVITSSKKLEVPTEYTIHELKNTIYYEWLPNEEMKKLFLTSDIFILPSYDEGLPYTLVEAMAYGLPVITSNVGGIPELVENNANGFIITPGDVDSLIDRILYLINHKDIRTSMSKNNKEKIVKHYSLEANLRRIENLYRKYQ